MTSQHFAVRVAERGEAQLKDKEGEQAVDGSSFVKCAMAQRYAVSNILERSTFHNLLCVLCHQLSAKICGF